MITIHWVALAGIIIVSYLFGLLSIGITGYAGRCEDEDEIARLKKQLNKEKQP